LGKWPIYDAFERGLLSNEEFINQLKNFGFSQEFVGKTEAIFLFFAMT
jgi:hypothetical protein